MRHTTFRSTGIKTPRSRWTFNKDETPEVILNFGHSSVEKRSTGADSQFQQMEKRELPIWI